MGKDGRDGCWLTMDLAVGGSNPSRRAKHIFGSDR